jgi:hypothetical protein
MYLPECKYFSRKGSGKEPEPFWKEPEPFL